MPKESNDQREILIIRAAHQQDYFIHSTKTAQDCNISYAALGLLTYLLSHPADWKTLVKDIAKRSTTYEAYKLLRELRKAGYMTLEKLKGQGERSPWAYTVYETTQQLIEIQQVGIQLVGNQHTYKVLNGKQSIKKNSLDQSKGRKIDPEFEIIAEIWNTRAGGYVSSMQGMIFGSKEVKGEWNKCKFDPPATVEELKDFGEYMFNRMADKNITEKPTTPTTIQKWFCDFRDDDTFTPASKLDSSAQPATLVSIPSKRKAIDDKFNQWRKDNEK